MVKIGKLSFNNSPRIAVAVSDKEDNELIKSMRAIDMLEIRLDQFSSLDIGYIKNSILSRRNLGIPLILTIRSKSEGGKRKIPDGIKRSIFKEIIPFVDAVDIELRFASVSEIIEFAKIKKKPVILSWHDFKKTPNNQILRRILDSGKEKGADIVKIAAKAEKIQDIINLAKFTQDNKTKNIITISLGKMGAISRVLFPMMGSLITYSYIIKPSGPGQLPLSTLKEHLDLYCLKYK